MSSESQAAIHDLLDRLDRGDRSALDELFPIVYSELNALAHRLRLKWQGDYTLNTTALLHEGYLKLAKQHTLHAETRTHFLALASKAMRHILVNYARDRRAQKRGGDLTRVTFADSVFAGTPMALNTQQAEKLVALDDALDELEDVDPRQGKVVECRFFGGMTVEETAEALGVSARTVKRDWAIAQAWLQRAIERAGA
jgi:RNA polymerase sigma factor (TIGR02999 family)